MPVAKKKSKKSNVDEDDILNQMLFDVPETRTFSARKPIPRLSSQASPSASSHKKKTTLLDDRPSKRPRLEDDPEPSALVEAAAPAEATIKEELEDISGIVAVPLDDDTKTNLEFHPTENGKLCTKFYWYDCCEGPNPGTVYFFGRIYAITVNKFVSCCVIIKNCQRRCYLMIAPNCTYEEAVGEFTHITAKQHKIKNFTCEKVTKKYAFSNDAEQPLVSDYVEVTYPAAQPSLPSELKGETFNRVLNVNQSPMEKIILDLKLRGPAWMRLVDPVAATCPQTWSRIELVLESPSNLLVEKETEHLKKPYFCVLSLALQTHTHPTQANRNDIKAISVMVNTTFHLDECISRNNKASGHFILMTRPHASHQGDFRLPYDFSNAIKDFKRTRLEMVNSERDLLVDFMDKFSNLDPDIVVGHDLLNFDFETLIRQMAINKIGTWSKLGRFKRSSLPSSKKAFPYLFSGRVLCDIKKSAEELMQLRSYDLTTLASTILDRKRVEYTHDTLVEAYKTSESLIRMLTATWEDVDSIFGILVELNIIPLALKITNITGNILSRTLAAGRNERNEYLLLHAFHEDNFICPEKTLSRERKYGVQPKQNDNNEDGEQQHSGRRKAAYTGGLVLEPKAGFYETCILLMDFNSLYPSIIQEFNICFSTVKVPVNDDESSTTIPKDLTATGILPAQLKNLVERRRQVKRLMADCKQPMQRVLLDIEQRALKLTANSMYGCLGFEHSRFYARHLASLVTSKGREILMSTKAMVENLGYEVIYGDTDSLMIDTKLNDYQEVIQRGNSIKQDINRAFRLLEIDIDGVYRPLLLLKKKNYAGASLTLATDGVTLIKKIETKGLDSVRRDRAVIAKEASDIILSMIMESDKEVCQIVADIHSYLGDLSARINRDELPKEKFLISKQLNRNPEEYRNTKGIGHVTIALRHNADPKKSRKLRVGDVIDYVICTDGTGESANQRCYTLEDMAGNVNLKLDYEYYLCQQIYTAISRICDKLPFTNAYAIAEAMGIESNSSIKIQRESTVSVMKDQLVSKGEQRFATCEPLIIECPDCAYIDKITSKVRRNSKTNKPEYSLTMCHSCNYKYALKGRQIVAQILGHLKRLTISLYNTRFSCSDCEYSTNNIFTPLNENDLPVCASCYATMTPDMDDRRLDLQLSYYKYLLDIENDDFTVTVEQVPADDTKELYKDCCKEILGMLKMSFINTIDAQAVFGMVCCKK